MPYISRETKQKIIKQQFSEHGTVISEGREIKQVRLLVAPDYHLEAGPGHSSEKGSDTAQS